MSATTDNLKAAFAGESQANMKYLAYAQKAEEEGYAQVAKLFRAAAEAERIHAHALLRALQGINSTADNLKGSIGGEKDEHTIMYPRFIEQAKMDGDPSAVRAFTYVDHVGKIHQSMYIIAADAIGKGQDLPAQKVFACPTCGNVEEGHPPEHCPVCGKPGSSFKEIV
jgi:rubrerythrin